MNRRQFVAATGTVAAAGFAGCSQLASGSTGSLRTSVSDQPGDISDFETLVLEITRVYAARGGEDDSSDDEVNESDTGNESDAEDDAGTEREEIDIEDTEVDLVELQGDAETSIGTGELPTGEYQYLQLEVGEVVEASLADGGEATVDTPGNAPLKFNESFEIRADETTEFLADFTPVKRGQSGSYILQPVADEVEVRYEAEGTETPSNDGNATNETA